MILSKRGRRQMSSRRPMKSRSSGKLAIRSSANHLRKYRRVTARRCITTTCSVYVEEGIRLGRGSRCVDAWYACSGIDEDRDC